MKKMFTKEEYTKLYLPGFDVELMYLTHPYETIIGGKKTNINTKTLPAYRELIILKKSTIHKKIAIYIDERFNTISNDLNSDVVDWLVSKYLELKKSDFRYGNWEENGINPTICIFLEDFLDYLKDDIRNFKINKLLNEEK
jgi:hypothetical protein